MKLRNQRRIRGIIALRAAVAASNSQPKIRILAETRMDLWEIVEYVGETLVFIGVVGEVCAEWSEPERKTLGKRSSIVLIVGLAASLAALFGTNEYFNKTIADLNLRAAEANDRAAAAEERLAKQGHRGALLLASQKRFSDQLRPFSGQKFELGVCPTFRDDWEVFELKSVLGATLSHLSGWTTEPDRKIYVCTAGVGIFARSSSSPSTQQAAKTLSRALGETLGRYQIGEIPATQVGLAITSEPKPPATLGEESSANDIILVVVGAHP